MEKTTFLPLLNTEFRIQTSGPESFALQLVEVSDLERNSDREPKRGSKGFSLLFSGSREFQLPQGMYRLEHEAIGGFDLFIVPVVPQDDQYFYYEAIFNFA